MYCPDVVQVLTLEDWELLMYEYIKYNDHLAAVYFVAWVVLGKYIFLTLFLAVVLEAFESKYDIDANGEAFDAF